MNLRVIIKKNPLSFSLGAVRSIFCRVWKEGSSCRTDVSTDVVQAEKINQLPVWGAQAVPGCVPIWQVMEMGADMWWFLCSFSPLVWWVEEWLPSSWAQKVAQFQVTVSVKQYACGNTGLGTFGNERWRNVWVTILFLHQHCRKMCCAILQ